VSYSAEWIPGVFFLGVVLPLLIVPGFAVVGLVVVVAAAPAILAAALIGIPYLLVRNLRRRLAEARQPMQRSAPMATAIGRPAAAHR
jgi:hypothetical protein